MKSNLVTLFWSKVDHVLVKLLKLLAEAAGLMQHMPQYWDQRAISAGYSGASPYDPIANINVSAWLLYQAAGGGWGHWSTY